MTFSHKAKRKIIEATLHLYVIEGLFLHPKNMKARIVNAIIRQNIRFILKDTTVRNNFFFSRYHLPVSSTSPESDAFSQVGGERFSSSEALRKSSRLILDDLRTYVNA